MDRDARDEAIRRSVKEWVAHMNDPLTEEELAEARRRLAESQARQSSPEGQTRIVIPKAKS